MRSELTGSPSGAGRAASRVRLAFDGSGCARQRAADRFTVGKLRREAHALSPLIEQLEQGRRLDIACGTGSLGRVLSNGASLVGVDSSIAMAVIARDARGYQDAIVADATQLPFHDGAFAAGSAIRLLHHLDAASRRAVLTEMRRVVRGRAVVSYFDAWTLEAMRASRRRAERGSRHAIATSQFELDALAAGWRLAAISRKLWRLTEHVYALLEPVPARCTAPSPLTIDDA